MRVAKFGGVLLACALAAACAKPTTYSPASPDKPNAQGYADTLVEPGRYRVTFTGNSVTTRDQVETALLLRAAEITLEQGGTWFRAVSEETETNRQQVGYVSGFGPYPYGYGIFGRRYRDYDDYGYWPASFQTREIKSYQAIMEILVMEGEKPEGDAAAYDAAEVEASLGPRVRLMGLR